MSRPTLLDLFCGAGGAAVGYHRAGFDVMGVDHRPQPRFLFRFVQADALEYLAEHGREFDAIHASPPCQAYSVATPVSVRANHPDLLAVTRNALLATGRIWVIENVVGAPMLYHVTLCGGMFGLRVYRHRRFETSHLIFSPPHPPHVAPATGARGNRERKRLYQEDGYHATICGNGGSHWGDAMGIDWMIGKELSQAIPPAYTEFIGGRLMAVVNAER